VVLYLCSPVMPSLHRLGQLILVTISSTNIPSMQVYEPGAAPLHMIGDPEI